MTSKITNQFSPEVRARAVRMVLDHASEHPSRWAAVTSIAAKIGCTPQTLHDGVKKAELIHAADHGETSRLSSSPPLNGSIGSTTEGSWSPLATYRLQRPSNATTPCWNRRPWRHNLKQIASGNPGAVQTGLRASNYGPRIAPGAVRLPAVATAKTCLNSLAESTERASFGNGNAQAGSTTGYALRKAAKLCDDHAAT